MLIKDIKDSRFKGDKEVGKYPLIFTIKQGVNNQRVNRQLPN